MQPSQEALVRIVVNIPNIILSSAFLKHKIHSTAVTVTCPSSILTVDERKNQKVIFWSVPQPPPPPYFNVKGARQKQAQEPLDITTSPASTITVNKQPHQHWTLGSTVQQRQVWTPVRPHRGASTLNIGERGPAASAWSQPIVDFFFDFLVHLGTVPATGRLSSSIPVCLRKLTPRYKPQGLGQSATFMTMGLPKTKSNVLIRKN